MAFLREVKNEWSVAFPHTGCSGNKLYFHWTESCIWARQDYAEKSTKLKEKKKKENKTRKGTESQHSAISKVAEGSRVTSAGLLQDIPHRSGQTAAVFQQVLGSVLIPVLRVKVSWYLPFQRFTQLLKLYHVKLPSLKFTLGWVVLEKKTSCQNSASPLHSDS